MNKGVRPRVLAAALVAPFISPTAAEADQPVVYRKPARAIAALIATPPTPFVSVSPDRKLLAVGELPAFLTIADLARPELRLAGLRLDPMTNGPSRRTPIMRITLLSRDGASRRELSGIPVGAKLGDAAWSPDSAHLAFTTTGNRDIALWVAEAASGRARRLLDRLNGAYGVPCVWLPDSSGLVCRRVPAERDPAPAPPSAPSGPIIQESAGVKAGARTFQDLLQSPHDEALFEHYLDAEIVRIGLDGATRSLGRPGLHVDAQPSPDGKWLLVETLHRPWSYVLPIDRFPRRFEVRDASGKLVRLIADVPLADRVPVTIAAVRTGPRHLAWRADAPGTLCWAEARDGGDPDRKASVRDELHCLRLPGSSKPDRIAELPLRYGGVLWGNDQLALVWEWWWSDRKTRTYVIHPAAARPKRVLWDRSFEDRYSDPGSPALRPTGRGTSVLHTTGGGSALFLIGEGASPEGDLPFLDRLDLTTGTSHRVWRSRAPQYEYVVEILDSDGRELLTRRESKVEQPNFHLLEPASGKRRSLTHFPHPAPQLARIEKRLIKYKRKDGVDLSAMLYLPPGWTAAKGRLPVLVWAYPQEFKTDSAASQVQDSPHRFVRLDWWSPLFALLAGYAVLDNPTLPIVGAGSEEPNDTYVEQLVAGAQAAVDEVVRLGVADRRRIAIGGHSYGAFMAANLLAHSDLFRAGIARSGAYNRSLTPFGFQTEERTYWQAPETYHRMSPFTHANAIDEPLLLIHGSADNNSGTYTMQSQRMYDALSGLGGTVRLVLLPHESHGYRARESVFHTLWEMTTWLDTHVKRARSRPQPPPPVPPAGQARLP